MSPWTWILISLNCLMVIEIILSLLVAITIFLKLVIFFKCGCTQKKLKVSFQVKHYNNSSFWYYFYFSLPQDEDNNCKYKKVIKNVINKPYKSFENLSLLFLFLNKQLNLSKHLLDWIFFFFWQSVSLLFFLLPEDENNL